MTVMQRTCENPGCDRPVSGVNLCCLRHWRSLPRGLRLKINKAAVVHGYGSAEFDVQMGKARSVWAEGEHQ